MRDQLSRLLDHPIVARLQTALFVGHLLVPALALLVVGVSSSALYVVGNVAWELLVAPSFAIFLLLWWLMGIASERLRPACNLQLEVMGIAFTTATNRRATIKVQTKVLNAGEPTRLSQWTLTATFDTVPEVATHFTNPVRAPDYHRLALDSSPLAAQTTNKQLARGQEREGSLLFIFPGRTGEDILEFPHMTLGVQDERGRSVTIPVNLAALAKAAEVRG